MESNKTQPEKQSSAAKPPVTSCRKKKNEEASFLEDVKEHIDEFIHASMDEHKTCFKKTFQKVLSHFRFHTNTSCIVWFISFVCLLFLLLENGRPDSMQILTFNAK